MVSQSLKAQINNSNSDLYNINKNKIAVQGYDLLSYFQGIPVKGKAELNYTYNGAVYYFKNDKNKNDFINFPERYIPQYGGWCAYAMGDSGEEVEINPETFKIIQGKLYLFYNKYFTNTLDDWNKNEVLLMIKANENWNKITKSI